MDKYCSSIEFDCECGACHELFSMQVFNGINEKFIEFFECKNVLTVRIFVDKEYINHNIITEIKSIFSKLEINFIIECMDCGEAEVFKANAIHLKDEEYIIVFGNSNLIELIKYYAGSVGVEFSIIVASEFYDFTFSRFARLYDGVSFSFYSVNSPQMIIFDDELINKIKLIDYISYIKAKAIAYFENLLSDRLDDVCVCKKINSKLNKIIKISNKITKSKDVLFTLIFLGRAISFFGGTKGFYGVEIEVTGFLEVLSKSNFLVCYNIASEAVKRIYNTALVSNLKIFHFDINKRIDKIKNILKLPVTKCLSFIKKQKNIQKLSRNIEIISALKYMLMNLLDFNLVTQHNTISPNDLAKAIYLAPEFSIKPTFLNIIRDLGLLENLV